MTAARRIGLVTPGWPGQNTPNGIATAICHLATGLHDIGQKPVIITRRVDGSSPLEIPVVTIPERPWRWRDRLRARFGDSDAAYRHLAHTVALATRDAAGSEGLDVLIMEETNGWAGMVRPLVPCPVVITLHGPWVLLRSLQPTDSAREDQHRAGREDRAFLVADGLIGPSRSVLEVVAQAVELGGKPRAVIPNALAVEDTGPLAAATASRRILFVGRFDKIKGADVVFEAFVRLCRTHPQARLTFVGVDKGIRQADGRMLHVDEALATLPPEVRERLTFTGPVDRAEVARLRGTHAIALIASRYETFGYTVLEAMAAGQAIVCTAVGGPAEVLNHEDTALMVPGEDPAAMAAALGRILDDAALAARLAGAGRARLLRDYSPAQVARDTVDFIERVLSGA